jgi:DNA-binding NtrC family response regulator
MDPGSASLFTVLVVDDEANYRAATRRLLAVGGTRVLEAEDGAQALAIVERERVNLVLLDLHMPVIDGLEVLKRVRRVSPTLPVIMITAFGEPGVAVEAMKAGADDFLEKNLSPQALEARVAQARRTWELEKDNRAESGGNLDAAEKTAIVNALAKCGGSPRAAAEELGISEATLHGKLRLHGIR